MKELFLIFLVVTTTAGACIAAKRVCRVKRTSVIRAVQVLLECIGASALFLAANLFIGVFFIAAIRGLTPIFIAFYVLGDSMLPALSVLQGFVFQLWWRSDS